MRRILAALILILVLVVSGCGGTVSREVPGECMGEENVDRCINILAIESEDEDMCGSIEDKSLKDRCLGQIGVRKNDASICRKAGEQKHFCLLEVARTTNDISLCGEMPGADEICYRHFAILENDVSICDRTTESGNLGRQYDLDKCRAYAAEKILDPEICSSLIQTDSWRNTCWQYMAVGSKDDSYCENVADRVFTEGKWVPSGAPVHCYSFTAKAALDYRICHKIPDENKWTKDSCYLQIAFKLKDPSICEHMSEGSINYENCLVQATPK